MLEELVKASRALRRAFFSRKSARLAFLTLLAAFVFSKLPCLTFFALCSSGGLSSICTVVHHLGGGPWGGP